MIETASPKSLSRLVLVPCLAAIVFAGMVGCAHDPAPAAESAQPQQNSHASSEEATEEDTAAGTDEAPPSDAERRAKAVEKLMKDTVHVIAASRDIPAGTPLTQDKVTSNEVPVRFLPPNPVLKDEFDIYAGTPVASNIEEGAMILTSDFAVMEISQRLSSRIPPGERAYTLPADQFDGPIELLSPGDRIDIIGTLPRSESRKEGDKSKVESHVLLQNVTLLSVGTRLSGVEDAPEEEAPTNITLSVTLAEAQSLETVRAKGRLSLLVRNSEDIEVDANLETQTLEQSLQEFEQLNQARKDRVRSRAPKPKKNDQIRIIRKPRD